MWKVISLWSGLGYYKRARNLKTAANILRRIHGGELPEDYEKLRRLPGIGDYTAGALLSIAFGKPYPALDGNARRVLGRIFLPHDRNELRRIARQLVSRRKPGEFNQALMELGSTVCVAANPRCETCPVASLCRARSSREPIARRDDRNGAAPRAVIWPLVIVRHNGKVLLRRRPPAGILAGLWELPGGEKTRSKPLSELFSECLPELHNARARPLQLGEVKHNITNRRIRAPVFLLESTAGARLDGSMWRWVAVENVGRQPTSAMTRKAIKLLSTDE
jgi:A/G-specific adenine glycosylase